METEKIIGKIQSALKSCAEDNGLTSKNVCVRLSLKKGFLVNEVICDLMKGTESIKPLNLKDLFGINPVQASLLKTKLSSVLTEFAKDEKINFLKINGRFYANDENYNPRLFLYNESDLLREMTAEELLN